VHASCREVGVDADRIRAVSGVYADAILSKLFRKFFRRQALRDEGWLAAHRSVHLRRSFEIGSNRIIHYVYATFRCVED